MKNKKLLVIGAGLAQVDAIQKAKDLGYDILASDGSSKAEGLKVANEARVLDVKDIEGNLAWAKEAKIDGVISYASDITLPTVLAIREALVLPGLGRQPMEISLDKSQQRVRFKKAGLAQPDFDIVENLEDFKKVLKRMGLPLVSKPVDNAGSRGVTLIFEMSQVDVAFQMAKEHTKVGKILVEQYIEGTELTVEGFSVDKKHHILTISDKYKPAGPYRVATQLAYPADITDKQEKQVIDLMTAAYDVMGVDNTPTHSEVIINDKGPHIVEVGCRGGGFYVFTRVVEAVSGYDIVGNWTRLCAGDVTELVERKRRGVVLRFYAAKPGKLVSVKGLDKAKAIKGVQTDLFVRPGDTVPELKTDGSRTGWMITRGKDRKEAVALADLVSETVQFETESVAL
ncbi:MAG: ATP-grasp domain-containing protein [Candidatus Omnitrophica bacterium]|nr:ATP-grasp domain-containing protein [Candidatus Omnitrophota bacterium]